MDMGWFGKVENRGESHGDIPSNKGVLGFKGNDSFSVLVSSIRSDHIWVEGRGSDGKKMGILWSSAHRMSADDCCTISFMTQRRYTPT